MSEINCIARFLAVSGKKNILIEELTKLIPLTISEKGCMHYELTEEIEYQGAAGRCWDVCLIETWRSREDFEQHCNTEYIKNFFDLTSKNIVELYDVRLYSPLM
ncbi:putative quinol monooxygenase [Yersinia mollaretii]|uniref:putative quinol monooxygenase n=1 Tax=Yersinia mollaretii TaxID=33060 RepID=UPI001643D4A8|nr:putative quinol monooxygenase [Yersinia mollaretii]